MRTTCPVHLHLYPEEDHKRKTVKSCTDGPVIHNIRELFLPCLSIIFSLGTLNFLAALVKASSSVRPLTQYSPSLGWKERLSGEKERKRERFSFLNPQKGQIILKFQITAVVVCFLQDLQSLMA